MPKTINGKRASDDDLIAMCEKSASEIIASGKNLIPMCFAEFKDQEQLTIMPLLMSHDKNAMRQTLFKILAEKGAERYTILFDTTVTELERDNKGKGEVSDAIIISVYTPTNRTSKVTKYKNKDVNAALKDKAMIMYTQGRTKDDVDTWDLWGINEVSKMDEVDKRYRKFKENNKELY